MEQREISAIRREYTKGRLAKCSVSDNPFVQFKEWLDEAVAAGEEEPTAMVVATVSADGHPSTRTVLLKGIENGKFIFYTNYESRKGRQLAGNPHVSLSFVWHKLERQVHIEGIAEKCPPQESDAYFASRPYKSRIGARISPQSRVIGSRIEIMRAFVREALHWAGKEVKRPDNWGGFAATPSRIEFWQGRPNRLHDRILYTLLTTGEWKKERLAP